MTTATHATIPNLRHGQNFLTCPVLVDALLARSGIGSGDVVYEIGPGRGIITERLAQRCGRVVAVEKDRRLASALQRTFASQRSVTVHAADFLDFPLPEAPYKVFANIPFNVTAAIVTRLTAARRPPQDAYLVMQREAAAKYTGQPRPSLYAMLLAPWFEASIVHRFARTDFDPVPSVEVVMLRLHKRGPPIIGQADAQLFRDFVVYGFTTCQPALRKTYRGMLTPLHFRKAGIDPNATATDLSFAQWLTLFHVYKSAGAARTGRKIEGSEQRLRRQQHGLRKMHRTRYTGRDRPPDSVPGQRRSQR